MYKNLNFGPKKNKIKHYKKKLEKNSPVGLEPESPPTSPLQHCEQFDSFPLLIYITFIVVPFK